MVKYSKLKKNFEIACVDHRATRADESQDANDPKWFSRVFNICDWVTSKANALQKQTFRKEFWFFAFPHKKCLI